KDEDGDTFVELWEDFCKDKHLILLGPLSQNEGGWIPSDADYIAEAVRDVTGKYTIDRQRVVAHGMGVGGQMAIYVGFNYPELFTGVAATGAVVQSIKDHAQGDRLSFYLAGGAVDPIV